MECRREGRAAGQDEAVEGREALVVLVDGAFELVDLCGDDAETRAVGLVVRDGRREIGAEVEEIMLHVPKDRGDARGEGVGLVREIGLDDGESDGGVGLIDRAVGLDAWIVLADALAGGEARGAVVAGAGIDLGEANHGGIPVVSAGESPCVGMSSVRSGDDILRP